MTFNPPGEPPVKALASTVTSPEERAELWPKAVKAFRQYAFYQYRTKREIPLVWLDPVRN